MQSFRARLERFSLEATPAVLTVFIVLFAAVPLRIPGLKEVMPLFALISIYYWNTFLPGALPYLFLFALGLVQDTLSGLPLGVSSVVNILFALLLLREHKSFGKTRFGAVWLGFTLLSFVAMAIEWVIMSFYSGMMLPVEGLLLQWAATCLAYPSMHLLFTRIYRMLLM